MGRGRDASVFRIYWVLARGSNVLRTYASFKSNLIDLAFSRVGTRELKLNVFHRKVLCSNVSKACDTALLGRTGERINYNISICVHCAFYALLGPQFPGKKAICLPSINFLASA